MTDATRESGLECADLHADELDKVSRLAGEVAHRFAALGRQVRTCRGVGTGTYRLLAFVGADGRGVGSVRAGDFLDAPDHLAVDLISSWVGEGAGEPEEPKT